MIEPSIKNLKAAVEELKKTEVNPVREKIGAIERPALQKGEMNPARGQRDIVEAQREQTSNGVKITETALSDLIQEKMGLEKVLQEINNLKGRICQRIGLIKTLERGKKEIERTSNFSEEAKKKLDNLRGHI